jgi:hypothetical protein
MSNVRIVEWYLEQMNQKKLTERRILRRHIWIFYQRARNLWYDYLIVQRANLVYKVLQIFYNEKFDLFCFYTRV